MTTTKAGDTFDAPPDPATWAFVECPDECLDECNEPHPIMRTGEKCSRGHGLDPCEGCAAWGEGCGSIWRRREDDRP